MDRPRPFDARPCCGSVGCAVFGFCSEYFHEEIDKHPDISGDTTTGGINSVEVTITWTWAYGPLVKHFLHAALGKGSAAPSIPVR